MKTTSIVAMLVVLLAIPLLILGVLALPPAQPDERQERFVDKTAEELMLETHELPKYRPPLNWERVLKGPAGEGVGLVDGVVAVYSRRYIDSTINQIVILEQVTERVHVFDSFDSARAFYDERLSQLQSGEHDVIFDTLGTTSACKGFYNRTSSADTMVAPCRYGNVVFEVKSISKEFKAKERVAVVINVTEGKF